MPQKTKAAPKSRVKVKDLPSAGKKMTAKDMKKIKGGAVDMFRKVKVESKD